MNDKQPFVSIIIPMYNRKELFSSIWKTINDQTYTNLEVIIVDDGSEKPLQIPKYFDDRFRLIRYETNKGPGYARRKGREQAQGKYIAYLDSDDEWIYNFLSSTVSILVNNEASMVFCNTLIRSKNSLRVRNKMNSGSKNFFDLIINEKTYWATGAALWRSHISIDQNWKEYRDHEDYLHDILSLYKEPTIYYLDKKLCIVNKNEKQGIKRSNADMLEVLINLSKNVLDKKRNSKHDLIDFIFFRLKKRKYNFKDFPYFFSLGKDIACKGYYKESLYLFKLYFKKISK